MRRAGFKLCTMLPPRAYLHWCAESPECAELQGIWRRPMWEIADGGSRPLRTNISVGDRVMHGHGHWQAHTPQLSLVIDKVLNLRTRSRYTYRIGWNIGGHDGRKTHEELTDGYWIWIPHFEQLVALGIDAGKAARLVLGKEE